MQMFLFVIIGVELEREFLSTRRQFSFYRFLDGTIHSSDVSHVPLSDLMSWQNDYGLRQKAWRTWWHILLFIFRRVSWKRKK